MREVRIMSKFKKDELIEVSNDPEFLRVGEPVFFQCDLSESKTIYTGGAPIVVVKTNGHSGNYRYARKIEPKVRIMQEGVCVYYTISKSLMDEIKAANAATNYIGDTL
jgi:hypothetical protein